LYSPLSYLASVAIAIGIVLPGVASALDASILGKVAIVKNITGAEADRAIVLRAKADVPSACGIGDVVSNPPTLRIVTTGATPSDVTYELPFDGDQRRPGWVFSSGGTIGAHYIGSVQGEPIKRLRFRFGASDAGCQYSISALVLGKVGTQDVTVVPPNPGTGLSMIYTDGFGNRLCASFGGAAGGTIATDTDRVFKILNPTSAPACP